MAERVCCLYRVSTNQQVDHNDNFEADIPVQRKACHEFASKKGWTIVSEEQENGVSGFKVSAEDRDKIQSIKSHAEQGKFDILLVFMFDRIGRKAEETPFVVEWLVQHGVQVWSVNEGEQRFESHTDRLTNYIRFWQADGESQKTAIRVKAALGQMVKEGRYSGGTVPYGYNLVKSGTFNKKKQEVSKLVVNEEQAKVIREIFNLSCNLGYGRLRIANTLNDHGIKNRNGQKWYDSTVGHILHNVIYTGVLKSGETYSEPFPEYQIIDKQSFDITQKLIAQRGTAQQEQRTMPLNTTGQALLSGNVFCGHCGGRLTLTTSGKSCKNAEGEVINKKRIRYVCYNKTRKRCECDGQTGYTMHILDDKVLGVLHQIFDKMKNVKAEDLVDKVYKDTMISLAADIKRTKSSYVKAEKEFANLKTEVVKAVQGKSKFNLDLLSELVDAAQNKTNRLSEELTRLNMEAESENFKLTEITDDYEKLLTWTGIFDESEMAVKKMVTAQIINRVEVFRDYKLNFVFNISFDQFRFGLNDANNSIIPDEQ